MQLNRQHLEEYDFYLARDDIPQGWEIVTLNDVSFVVTDGTHKTPQYMPNGVRFISIRNIRPYRPIDWTAYEKYISRQEHTALIKRCHPEKDDILFPRIGTLGFAKRIDFNDEISIFVGLGLIKPIKAYIFPKYLEHYMNTPYIGRLSIKRAKGTGRKTLPLEESRRFPFPVAPFPEQLRIVDKIDELFSELDKGVESLETARAQLNVYRQAVLKHAFEGKLSAQWREENKDKLETPEIFLLRIARKREAQYDRRLQDWEAAVKQWESGGNRSRKPVKPKRAKSPIPVRKKNREQLFNLPKGWTWTRLAYLFDSSPQDGIYKPASEYGSGTQIIRIDDFYDGRLIRQTGFKRLQLSVDEIGKYMIRNSDLMVNRVNSIDYLGKCAVVGHLAEPTVFESNIMKCSFVEDEISVAYIAAYLSSKEGRKHLCENAKHAVNQASINQTDVGNTLIPIASKEEQILIMQKIEGKLSRVDAMTTQIDAHLAEARVLRQSILKKAFSGQLVSQDLRDEPAPTLLARIRATANAEKPRVNS